MTSKMTDINVFFIRHGESLANAGNATSDPATIRLTERGFAQATQIAERFERAPTLIVTSAYLRTQQTAQPTIERFPQTEQAQWPVQEFTYLSPQRCVSMTAAQRRPFVEEYWERCDINFVDGPGAESFASLVQRAKGTLEHLQRWQKNHDIAIFTAVASCLLVACCSNETRGTQKGVEDAFT